eukprot:TRINITY_DN1707_c0_g1_i12.p3 TRINITY_DN1707_c0_g1~~TRINITY_DN1707_c0_g1_i12.p3  ORF type:complete len:188 (+),score=-28.30 TRINITY_DN1707_c0_g1_i12:123-686(+)
MKFNSYQQNHPCCCNQIVSQLQYLGNKLNYFSLIYQAEIIVKQQISCVTLLYYKSKLCTQYPYFYCIYIHTVVVELVVQIINRQWLVSIQMHRVVIYMHNIYITNKIVIFSQQQYVVSKNIESPPTAKCLAKIIGFIKNYSFQIQYNIMNSISHLQYNIMNSISHPYSKNSWGYRKNMKILNIFVIN